MKPMRALIVYESMYGNTHVVASHIADGLGAHFETEVMPVEEATIERVLSVDSLVIGGPTHVHGMSSERSREAARDAVQKHGSDLTLDPDAEGEGLRDWFHGLPRVQTAGAVAFDT